MRNERGIALVFVLFLLTTVSALAVSLTFLANSETYASGNYRLVTQARYGAESGIQKAADFLLDPAQYNPATAAPGGTIDNSVSPVTWNGQPIVLHTVPAQSHYPDAATEAAFAAAATGNLTAGSAGIAFGGYATLLTEDSFFDRYIGATTVVQTWQITSDATITSVRTSTVEVGGMIETRKVPALAYAAFGVDPGCGSLDFNGTVGTDSYSSKNLVGATAPTYSDTGGDVGTNGNLNIEGHVGVEGDLYSPKVGVGACNAGNVTALTESGAASVSGNNGLPKKLPKVISFPTPSTPAPSPLPAVNISGVGAGTCALLGLIDGTNCSVNPASKTITIKNTNLTPLTLPSMNLDSQVNLVLTGTTDAAITNTYNMNSISLAGQSTISVSTPTKTATIVVNVSGKNPDGSDIATPIDFVGGTFASPDLGACGNCSIYDAKILEFMYGGTGTIRMTGNSGAAATFYAPKAAAVFSGTADLYGAIIADTVSAVGTFKIHYDDTLGNGGWTKSTPMMTAFSWKKY